MKNRDNGGDTGVGAVGDSSRDEGESGDTGTTDLGDVPVARRAQSRWIPRAAVAALVLAVGVAVVAISYRGTETPPPDGAEVLARAGTCQSLIVEEDGWRFRNQRPTLDGDLPVGAPIGGDPMNTSPDPTAAADDPFDGWDYPARWHGDDIAGRLYVDGPIEGSDQGGVEARFVADDGTEISMSGHPPSAEVFDHLACSISGNPSAAITDRYAVVAADGPLPPVVGPAKDLPTGFRYAGMRSPGSGADRSVVLRFERPAKAANPNYDACVDAMPRGAPETTETETEAEMADATDGCGPADDQPAEMVLLCVTTADGCRAQAGETQLEIDPAPAPDAGATRSYLIGPQATISQWAEVTYTSDVTLMGWPM